MDDLLLGAGSGRAALSSEEDLVRAEGVLVEGGVVAMFGVTGVDLGIGGIEDRTAVFGLDFHHLARHDLIRLRHMMVELVRMRHQKNALWLWVVHTCHVYLLLGMSETARLRWYQCRLHSLDQVGQALQLERGNGLSTAHGLPGAVLVWPEESKA